MRPVDLQGSVGDALRNMAELASEAGEARLTEILTDGSLAGVSYIKRATSAINLATDSRLRRDLASIYIYIEEAQASADYSRVAGALNILGPEEASSLGLDARTLYEDAMIAIQYYSAEVIARNLGLATADVNSAMSFLANQHFETAVCSDNPLKAESYLRLAYDTLSEGPGFEDKIGRTVSREYMKRIILPGLHDDGGFQRFLSFATETGFCGDDPLEYAFQHGLVQRPIPVKRGPIGKFLEAIRLF